MDRLRHHARALRHASTDAERLLWQCLRIRQIDGFRFRRQAPIAGYIVDFVCPQAGLVVELDGGQHAEQREYDETRTRALQHLGYRVIRYWNHDVIGRTADVLEDIRRHLEARATPSQPPPSATRKGEG